MSSRPRKYQAAALDNFGGVWGTRALYFGRAGPEFVFQRVRCCEAYIFCQSSEMGTI
ncbi:MAG: hypothetical protein VXZ81_04895 [Pseudomonadota bacterium]|nr:hypothetical protein [Pseudomonadota bacterium]